MVPFCDVSWFKIRTYTDSSIVSFFVPGTSLSLLAYRNGVGLFFVKFMTQPRTSLHSFNAKFIFYIYKICAVELKLILMYPVHISSYLSKISFNNIILFTIWYTNWTLSFLFLSKFFACLSHFSNVCDVHYAPHPNLCGRSNNDVKNKHYEIPH